MTFAKNQVRSRRRELGLTQAELALRAGISRTAVTAIEGNQLAPSVETALALAEVMETTVEELFGRKRSSPVSEVWAWKPPTDDRSCWQAEVLGKTVFYPASSKPNLTSLPDRQTNGTVFANSPRLGDTLVIACCDPAAGLLASQFAAATGLRMIVLSRSSGESVEMLRDGLVHMAGLHLSTRAEPQRNEEMVRTTLGAGFHMLRIAWWQEGIALKPTTRLRSVRDATRARLNWIGRQPGSGARRCLDDLLGSRADRLRIASDHRSVAEAVRSGWADTGICVQLVCDESGLNFLPVQQEAFDVCFPPSLAEDRRVKAFINVVRSVTYRKLLGELPGYDIAETGSAWSL